ncbi:MAG: ABC transporter permease [Muribaculaceae bacterium]|nr:ABC transporter permease [Muribaculaceae bacterium]
MRLTIFDIENWKEIGATLMRNKTRTFLTGFGIFWGVAMLALLTGGARGGGDMLRRNFAGFATNTAGVIPSNTTMPYKGYQKGRWWQMTLGDAEMIKAAFPELDAVVPTSQRGAQSFKRGKYTYSGQLAGVTEDYTKILQPRLYEGRFVNEADVQNERKVAVIGKKVAGQLFPDGSSPIGKMVEVAGAPYAVIGVVGDVSEIQLNGSADEGVFIPASTFRRIFGYGDKIDFLMLTGKDTTNLSEVLPKIQTMLARRHDFNPSDKGAVWIINIAEQFEQIDKLFLGIDLLAWFIGLATLIAGVIGIGNIMWVIVKERTQEIGIRRAIGAKPRDIIVQVLSEGIALTLLFGLAGVTFATIVLAVMQASTNPADAVSVARFQMSFKGAVVILTLFVLMGTLAGIIPSLKAMRIKPIEAINSK